MSLVRIRTIKKSGEIGKYENVSAMYIQWLIAIARRANSKAPKKCKSAIDFRPLLKAVLSPRRLPRPRSSFEAFFAEFAHLVGQINWA